ncbi:hypothetical protein AB6A40_006845 [Gnathostoma spinigerum]|uniref:GPI ethanolamine phosphate transferase 1 n=1 Tax=Gnathostoma spinigerum TaxID=75299 RepID=A0ABD6EK44_9BILA
MFNCFNKKKLSRCPHNVFLNFSDGLRSESFYKYPEKSPFLHDIIRNGKGRWGVSVSHVPTESRPGHVSMFAGFYEDVSAIARGWKKNPVAFDSVFNRSREAWGWGSPDIVPMFAMELEHVHADVYSSELEDFLSANASHLDEWVFEKVEAFFSNSVAPAVERLRADRIVFFLHLLGLDTNGHGYKPTSDQYINNIAVVDRGVKRTVEVFNSFYEDNRTAYIFTADHGMTDWGSHGAGTDAEILVPFVVWGSGIKSSFAKEQIDQVDIAPLISALLGVAMPMNSVGILPLSLLRANPKYQFQSSYSNFKQILQQFKAKREEKKMRSLPLMFKEYPQLTPEILKSVEREIFRLVELRRYEAAANVCLDWMPKVRSGLLYFHRYERFFFGCAIAASFVSWILLIYTFTTRRLAASARDSELFFPSRIAVYLVIFTLIVLLMRRTPLMSCVYAILPVYLSSVTYNIYCHSLESQKFPQLAREMLEKCRCMTNWEIASIIWKKITVAFLFCMFLAIFVTIFTHRSLLSLMVCSAAIMPWYEADESRHFLSRWKRLWSCCCLLLVVFPQLPPVGTSPSFILVIFPPLLVSLFLYWWSRTLHISSLPKIYDILSIVHLMSAFCILYTEYSISIGRGSPFISRLLSWLSIPFAFVLPLFAPSVVSERLVIWFSSLFVPYSLLSLSYESIFLLFLYLFLLVYVRFEFDYLADDAFLHLNFENARHTACSAANDDVKRPFRRAEWKRVVLMVILFELAFFGTGNIASINSFNPTFLRCFISVFSPFVMTALLLFKISIPFLAVALTFAIPFHGRASRFMRNSILLLIISDSMALVFFFRLKDEGSWLDIGTTISHYVISLLMTAIVFCLVYVSKMLLPLSICDFFRKQKNHFI